MAEQQINIYEDPKKARAQIKAERKKLKAQEKQQYKELKQKNRDLDEREGELDQTGGGITSFFLTVAIVVMWLLIMALLIRLDVGGFGSSVMAPILRDVPYLNRILPESARTTDSSHVPGSLNSADGTTAGTADGAAEGDTAGTTVPSGTGTATGATDAEYIRQLESRLAEAEARNVEHAQTIDQQTAEITRLRTFEEQWNAIEDQRTQFYNDIVYNDNAPDPANYIQYYEMIEPAYASQLYRDAVRNQVAEEDVEVYARTYSSMKPKQAAAIFDEMVANGTEHDVTLAARILLQMTADDRGLIMGRMEEANAAVLTDIMEPDTLPYP
ncbi:MAG: hypothetical protein IJP92_09280 [Lachnospiraceae bacterium]|nr:hypothetical protein [Lachnospiraceae bacterium]